MIQRTSAVILSALETQAAEATEEPEPALAQARRQKANRETLEQMFSKVRGLADDLDLPHDPLLEVSRLLS